MSKEKDTDAQVKVKATWTDPDRWNRGIMGGGEIALAKAT